SFIEYIHEFSKGKSDYFKEHYVDPKSVTFDVIKPKNLILIYVESLENTYSDKQLFGYDLLHSLHELKGISFKNYIQMPGTGWTIAAMVSTQCGVPLKTMTFFHHRESEFFEKYLGNAECLSDIL